MKKTQLIGPKNELHYYRVRFFFPGPGWHVYFRPWKKGPHVTPCMDMKVDDETCNDFRRSLGFKKLIHQFQQLVISNHPGMKNIYIISSNIPGENEKIKGNTPQPGVFLLFLQWNLMDLPFGVFQLLGKCSYNSHMNWSLKRPHKFWANFLWWTRNPKCMVF